MKSYIRFDKLPRKKGAKTDRWEVNTEGKDYDDRNLKYTDLGIVQWFVWWRRYVFAPKGNTLYDPGCLREIADFCERETKQHALLRKLGETP